MAEPAGRRDAKARAVVPDGGDKAPRKIEVEINVPSSEIRLPIENFKQLDAISFKLIDDIGRVNSLILSINGNMLRLQSSMASLVARNAEVARAMARSKAMEEEVARRYTAKANTISRVNAELNKMARNFNYVGEALRKFEDATKEYVAGITSLIFLPVAVVKGFAQSINDAIKAVKDLKREAVAFDKSIMNSINTLNKLAERGGIIARIASALRVFPVTYARITRGIPRRIRRAIGRLRKPRIAEAIRLMELGRPLNESLQEQRRMSRFLLGILGGITSITGFFTRLLRYVWEILIVQKLGGLMGALGGTPGKILAEAGLGAIIIALKAKLVAFASMIGSVAGSIGSALSAFSSKIGAFITGTVGGLALVITAILTAGGKVAEALGINADVIGKTAQGLRARAEEAERHGNAIAAAFFNTASNIHGFAQQVWIAGDQAKEWLSTRIPVIGGALGELAQGLLHGVSAFMGGIGTIIGLMGEVVMRIQDFATWLSGGVREFINRAQGTFDEFVNWASSNLKSIWEGFTSTLSNVLSDIESRIKGAWDVVINGLKSISDKLDLGKVFDDVTQTASNLGSMFQGAVDAVKGFIHALTGRNPGVLMRLEELGSSLRRTSTLIGGVREVDIGGKDYYGTRLIDLVSELISEVRELRRDISRLKPEVNVSVKTTESAYIRR